MIGHEAFPVMDVRAIDHDPSAAFDVFDFLSVDVEFHQRNPQPMSFHHWAEIQVLNQGQNFHS